MAASRCLLKNLMDRGAAGYRSRVAKSQTGLSIHSNTQGKLGEVAWPDRLTFRGQSGHCRSAPGRGN